MHVTEAKVGINLLDFTSICIVQMWRVGEMLIEHKA